MSDVPEQFFKEIDEKYVPLINNLLSQNSRRCPRPFGQQCTAEASAAPRRTPNNFGLRVVHF